jgi:hypothetical protein
MKKKKTKKSDHRCSYTEVQHDGYGEHTVCKHCSRSRPFYTTVPKFLKKSKKRTKSSK